MQMAALSFPSPASLGTDPRVVVVCGRDEVLARLADMAELVAGTHQQAELAEIEYFFDKPSRIHYTPTLALVYPSGSGLPAGAVLLLDSWFLVGRGKFYTASNRRGRRTVFATVEQRTEVAAVAAQALLEQGAAFINIDIDLGPQAAEGEEATKTYRQAKAVAGLRLHGVDGVGTEWALHNGVKRFDLPLRADYDATLAALGRQTRRNLRYYERMCVNELGCRFVGDVSISREAFLALNEEVRFSVDRKTANWRYDAVGRYANVFMAGMQRADGTWLSLISGRRSEGEVVIDWQMNRKGLERYSLSTAMRSMLIHHEIAIGSTSLAMEGGTSHAMAEGFRMRSVYNLAVRRPSVWLRVAERLLARLGPEKLVTKALVKPWRRWVPCRWPGSPPA